MALILRHGFQFLFQKQSSVYHINISSFPNTFFNFICISCQNNIIQRSIVLLRQLPYTVKFIFNHIVYNNIKFILKTNSDSWTEAAYNAFINRTGNCYSTVYAVKVLLDVAGIENMIIERWPYETATHFWNYVKLNGQWYHWDATWREGYDSYFFMYTTKELQNFWQGGWNGFQYRVDDYPESATESVQSRIDYRNHTIKEQ